MDRQHAWYPWYWSDKRARQERECSIFGCTAFQYLEGTLIAAERIVLTREGKEHVHEWGPWGGVDEHHVEENRFYARVCPCGAVEETGHLREIGKLMDFQEER